MTATPYCPGARCADCEPPAPDDVHGEEDCCEATCGLCPRVEAHGHCRLAPGYEEDSKYCDQHGEGSLNVWSADAFLTHMANHDPARLEADRAEAWNTSDKEQT